MARTALFGVLGPFVGAALAAVGCGMTTIYIDSATGTTTTNTNTSTTSSATGGAGGALLCAPGATQPCYSGPAGTEGQGVCQAGAQTCSADGMSWGACSGEVVPGLEDCATAEDEDCDGIALVCGATIWAMSFGDMNDGQASQGVAVDGAGNVFIVGYFVGSADFGGGTLTSAGDEDIFVAKLDPNGNHLWSKRFGGTGTDTATSVAVDGAGDVLLTGTSMGAVDFGGGSLSTESNSAVFVVKLDGAGDHQWSKLFGNAGSHLGLGIAVDHASRVIVTGATSGAVDFGGGAMVSAGGSDIFVAKLDVGGEHLWSKVLGTTGAGAAIAANAAGDVLLTGYFSGTASFGGDPLVSANGSDAFVAKLSPDGGHMWSRHFGDMGTGIAVDIDGNVLATGTFSGSIDLGGGPLVSVGGSDIFVAKLAADGSYMWGRQLGDTSYQQSSAIAADATGHVLLTGSFSGTIDFGGGPLGSAGGGDVFVVKLEPTGAHRWSRRFGDPAEQLGQAMATDSDGNVFVTGSFYSAIDFGGAPVASHGGSDIFVAKFGP